MYVCICNSVTDRQIRAAVEQGVKTFGQLRAELGVATCCGRCESCARNLLNDLHTETGWTLAPLPAAS